MPRSIVLGLLLVSTVLIATWVTVRPEPWDAADLPNEREYAAIQWMTLTDHPSAGPLNTFPLGVRVVRDEDGLPIAGARASFAEVDAFGVPPERITDADGRARWDVPRGVPWTLIVEARDRGIVRTPIAYSTRNLTVRLHRFLSASEGSTKSTGLTVRLVDVHGVELVPADLDLDAQSALAIGIAVSDACGTTGGEFGARGGVLTSRATPIEWNGSRFAWRVKFASLGRACVHAVIGDLILASGETAGAFGELQLRVDRDQLELARAPFVVRVIDAKEERGLADAQVTARTPAGFTVTRSTDEHGRARFDDLLAYEFEIEAVGSGHCSARRRVQRPVHAEIEMVLQLGREVRGSVVDESGRLMPHSVIGLFRWPSERASEAPLQIATADADGRFAFTGASRDAIVLAGAEADAEPLLTSATDPWMCFVEAGGDASGLVIRVEQFAPPFPGKSR